MKNLKMNLAIICLSTLSLTSCLSDGICMRGSGVEDTRTVTVDEFDEIVTHGSFRVEVSQGNQEIEVIGDDNLIDEVEFNVKNGALNIEMEEGCYRNLDIEIKLTTPDVKRISVRGSGTVDVNNFEDQNDLILDVSGSGDIKLNEFHGLQHLDIEVSGSGNVAWNGTSTSAVTGEIDINGSGNYNGYQLAIEDAEVDIDGSGNCRVRANDKLDVKISGSGNVKYKGYPTISTKIIGSGSVVNAN